MEIGLAITVMLLGAALAVQSFRLWLAKNSLMDAKENMKQCVRDYEEHIGQRVVSETYTLKKKISEMRHEMMSLAEKFE